MNASLTKPMSANSPSRWYWPRWLSFYWGMTNFFGRVAARSAPANWVLIRTFLGTMEKLVKLSFINFARWSIVRRVPANGDGANTTRLPYGYVLFETNYNGDQDLYFEAFSLVTPVAMMLTWQGCYDVPWIPDTGRFIDFIDEKELQIDYSYTRFPDATSKVIRQALALKRELDEFQRTAPADPGKFRSEYTSLLTRVQTLADPRPPVPRGLRKVWHPAGGETSLLSILSPVKAAEKAALNEDLARVGRVLDGAHAGARKLFPENTHFARWVVIDPMDVPNSVRDEPRDEQAYLLFSAWFDGCEEKFLDALYRTLGSGPVGPRLWRHCGFDEAGDTRDFRDYMLHYRVDWGVKFSGYDGSTVEQVRHALHFYDQFFDFAVTAQAFDADELKCQWEQRDWRDIGIAA